MQTLAILLDSFRLLRARKMFWLVFGLSLIVALLYGSVGYDETGWSILFGRFHFDSLTLRTGSDFARAHYQLGFSEWVVGAWLSWGAIILALVATSSIFVDFMAPGSIDIALSKPISRVRLFFTKYLGCLLFTALQTALLCGICFLCIGLRVGIWKPEVFLAVPLVTAIYSFIFCVIVLLAVWTRSTLVALLVGMLFWFAIFLVQFAEKGLKVATNPDMQKVFAAQGGGGEPNFEVMESLHKKLRSIQRFLPRTQETAGLMKRGLTPGITAAELQWQEFSARTGGAIAPPEITASRDIEAEYANESPASILLPSFAFEAVILLLACWLFCRRDY